jgi:hypothetical protein
MVSKGNDGAPRSTLIFLMTYLSSGQPWSSFIGDRCNVTPRDPHFACRSLSDQFKSRTAGRSDDPRHRRRSALPATTTRTNTHKSWCWGASAA